MSSGTLIVVLGPCGAGKTTIARAIAGRYQIPLISRDTIKEMLFDTVGFGDREWSRKLGRASYQLLHFFTEKLLAVGSTFIIESNFEFLSLTEGILRLRKQYNFRVILVRCFAERQTLFGRAIKRDASGERHPGHVGPGNYEMYRTMLLENDIEFMHIERDVSVIDAKMIDVDTTHFGQAVYDKVYTSLSEMLGV